jgi:hypothetical protein|tara:strand:- start:176 stop:523 length:348 start_codon:yes stop_codon:yes gene_type:complete
MTKCRNNLSYEQYLKEMLYSMSPNLAVKAYKRSGGDPLLKATFDKDKDYRILFTWRGEPIKSSQFIVDRQFWHMANRNDEDRIYMRRWADIKLKTVKDAIERGKKKKNGRSKRPV